MKIFKKISECLIVISFLCILFLSSDFSLAQQKIDPTLSVKVSNAADLKGIRIQGSVSSKKEQLISLAVYYSETPNMLGFRAQKDLVNAFIKPTDGNLPIDYILEGLKANTVYYVSIVNGYNFNYIYQNHVSVKTLNIDTGFNGSSKLQANFIASSNQPDVITISGNVVSPLEADVKLVMKYKELTAPPKDTDVVSVDSIATGFVVDKHMLAGENAKAYLKFSAKPNTYYYVSVTDATNPDLVYLLKMIKTSEALKKGEGYGSLSKTPVGFTVDSYPDQSKEETKDTVGTRNIIGTVTNSSDNSIYPYLKIAFGTVAGKLDSITDTVFGRPINGRSGEGFEYNFIGLELNKNYYYRIVDGKDPRIAYTSEKSFTAMNGEKETSSTPKDKNLNINANLNVKIPQGGLVPCLGDLSDPCDFNDLVTLANNFITFAIKISFPIFVIIFAYAGWLYLSAGASGEGANEKAKQLFTKALIGLLIVLGSWLVVNSVLKWVLSSEYQDSAVIDKLQD